MLSLRLTIVLSLLLTLPVAAGERTFRVLFIGNTNNTPKTIQLFDGKQSHEIELPQMNLSPIYQLPSGPLNLHLLENAPENPEDIPKGSPKASLDESISDFYLFVGSDPENKTLPLSMRIVRINHDKFRVGELLWFNLTPNRIGGTVGSRKLLLTPNEGVITKSPTTGTQDYPVDIYYQIPGKNDVWPLCETKWLHNPQARMIMLVIQEPGSRTPLIMGFTDFREQENKGVN